MRHRYMIDGPCEWCGRTNIQSLYYKDGGECHEFEREHQHVWGDSGFFLVKEVDIVVDEGPSYQIRRTIVDKSPEVEVCKECGLLRMKAPAEPVEQGEPG